MVRKSEFGSNWWAQRWISTLESFGWDTRLQRGRSYARSGKVLDIQVGKGEVTARVQGSRPKPYKVTIKLSPLNDADWEMVLRVMAEKALFAAKLLSGQMPENIEEAFKETKVSLFPKSSRDLATDCSCPDFANPCKHIAAVYYLLGSEFDRDPFLLFWLRGRTKEQAIAALRSLRAVEEASYQDPAAGDTASSAEEAPPPLESDLTRFWISAEELATVAISVSPPKVPESLLRRLGPPPFGQGSEAAHRALVEMYRIVSARALELADVSEPISAGPPGSREMREP